MRASIRTCSGWSDTRSVLLRRCKCSVVPCSSSADCGAGSFCDVISGTCKPCHECASDAAVAGGSCSDTCPFGSTDDLQALLTAEDAIAQRFDYLSFTAQELFSHFRVQQVRSASRPLSRPVILWQRPSSLLGSFQANLVVWHCAAHIGRLLSELVLSRRGHGIGRLLGCT